MHKNSQPYFLCSLSSGWSPLKAALITRNYPVRSGDIAYNTRTTTYNTWTTTYNKWTTTLDIWTTTYNTWTTQVYVEDTISILHKQINLRQVEIAFWKLTSSPLSGKLLIKRKFQLNFLGKTPLDSIYCIFTQVLVVALDQTRVRGELTCSNVV